VLQTDQVAPHADLTDIVRRHQQHPWRKPCPAHTREAFEQFMQTYRRDPRPIVLDSFCGTGMSTAILAAQFPDAWVVGIDQSAHRLAKHQPTERRNYHLLRAEAEPFWCCLAEAGIRLHSHWLLYPNPWPKASQFKKRLHGHGAFPMLAQLGGALEMRTNWHLFAEEFALAADLIGLKGSIDMASPTAPMTLFERKYQERGQTLWRFSGEFSN
jgi:tRNA (guanine-N7-)-methyltransferase